MQETRFSTEVQIMFQALQLQNKASLCSVAGMLLPLSTHGGRTVGIFQHVSAFGQAVSTLRQIHLLIIIQKEVFWLKLCSKCQMLSEGKKKKSKQ